MGSYKDDGLAWKSNIITKPTRDESGNIKLQENATEKDNPDVFIDPVLAKFTVENFINLIDTRFSYFKFPTTAVAEDTNIDYDTELSFEAFDESSFVYDVITQDLILVGTGQQPEVFNREDQFAVATTAPSKRPSAGWNLTDAEYNNVVKNGLWMPQWVQYSSQNSVTLSKLSDDGEPIGSGRTSFVITRQMREQLKTLDDAWNSKAKSVKQPYVYGGDRPDRYIKPEVRHAIKFKCSMVFKNANWYNTSSRALYTDANGKDLNNYYFIEFGLDDWRAQEQGYSNNIQFNPGSRLNFVTTNASRRLNYTPPTATKYSPSTIEKIDITDFDTLYNVLQLAISDAQRYHLEEIINGEGPLRFNKELGVLTYSCANDPRLITEWMVKIYNKINTTDTPGSTDLLSRRRGGWSTTATLGTENAGYVYYDTKNNTDKYVKYLPFNSYDAEYGNLRSRFIADPQQTRWQIYIWLHVLGYINLSRFIDTVNGKRIQVRIQVVDSAELSYNEVTNEFISLREPQNRNYRLSYIGFPEINDWFYQSSNPNTAIQIVVGDVQKTLDRIHYPFREQVFKNMTTANINRVDALKLEDFNTKLIEPLREQGKSVLRHFDSFAPTYGYTKVGFEYIVSPDLLDAALIGDDLNDPKYSINVSSVTPSYIDYCRMEVSVVQLPKKRTGDITTPKKEFDGYYFPIGFVPKDVNIFKWNNWYQNAYPMYYGSYQWGHATIDDQYVGLVNASDNLALCVRQDSKYIPIGTIINGQKFNPFNVKWSGPGNAGKGVQEFIIDGLNVDRTAVDCNDKFSLNTEGHLEGALIMGVSTIENAGASPTDDIYNLDDKTLLSKLKSDSLLLIQDKFNKQIFEEPTKP